MSLREHRSTIPIEPIYRQAEPNAPIPLGKSAVIVDFDGTQYRGAADITLQFVPTHELFFDAAIPELNGFAALAHSNSQQKPPQLIFPDRGSVVIDTIQIRPNRFTPRRSVVDASPTTDRIKRTVFHLLNFPDFCSSTDYILTNGADLMVAGGELCGRVTLAGGGWTITICALEHSSDNNRALQSRGGWLITHVGEIVRDDGSLFTSTKLKQVLKCLHYFLSFSEGRWSGLALPVAFNESGDTVFEQWGLPLASAGCWTPSSSWFDSMHGDMLPAAFSGFWALWNRDVWRNALSESLYWYLAASHRGVGIGVDTGIILAQTALELLAWNHCVQDRKMVSAKAFQRRGLSAADRFRLLATSLNIPAELPAAMTALHSKQGEKWEDAMAAITGIRNGIVHPVTRRRPPLGSEYEAWRLSLWFLDLIILRLCNYSGPYASRLFPMRFAGQVEQVPWAPK